MDSKSGVVILSRGSTWKPDPYASPPYLFADSVPFPDGASASIMFTDTSSGELATFDATSVTPQVITFSQPADDVDPIPNGSNFEIFLTDGDDTYQIRYGKVIRREVTFTNAPATVSTSEALLYTDTFPTLGLRSSWQAVNGRTKVFDNSGSSLVNGVGPNVGLLFAQSAIRWSDPLNSDTVKVNVNLLNQGTGKARVIVSADQRFTTYLAVEFEESAHRIHLCTGTDPVTVTYQGSAITNTVADNDNYTIYYNNATDTLSVYKGDSGTALGSWNDASHVMPHGPGYRYAGLAWVNSGLLSSGIQVSYWSAKDDV